MVGLVGSALEAYYGTLRRVIRLMMMDDGMSDDDIFVSADEVQREWPSG